MSFSVWKKRKRTKPQLALETIVVLDSNPAMLMAYAQPQQLKKKKKTFAPIE
jgi:hypothetical protein